MEFVEQEKYKNEIGIYKIENRVNNSVYVGQRNYKLVGAKNRQRMLGTKLPDSTKQKMSEARKGKYYYKSTDTITPDTARKIKEMYLSGHTSRDIGAALNVPYRVLNNILSANGWSTVKVDGWEEFCNTRNKHKGVAVNGKKQCARTKTKEEVSEIRRLYREYGTYSAVKRILHCNYETIRKYVDQKDSE